MTAKLCEYCHWNWDDKGRFQNCFLVIGLCHAKSKWMQRRETFAVEGNPASRYDIHVSGLSTVGQELKFELPVIGEE